MVNVCLVESLVAFSTKNHIPLNYTVETTLELLDSHGRVAGRLVVKQRESAAISAARHDVTERGNSNAESNASTLLLMPLRRLHKHLQLYSKPLRGIAQTSG
jgi:hypothetical protein